MEKKCNHLVGDPKTTLVDEPHGFAARYPLYCFVCGGHFRFEKFVSSALSSDAETTQSTPTTPSEWGDFREQAIRVFQRHGRNEYAGGAKGAYKDLEYRIKSLLHHNTEDIIGEIMKWASSQGKIHAQLAEEIVGNNDWHKAKVEQAEELTNLLRALKPTHKEYE